ncbi:hypothetical protein ACTXT7_002572 [Hymenolepis weldensis]
MSGIFSDVLAFSLVKHIMHSTKDPQYLSTLHPSFLSTTLANPGDILFSTTTTNHRSNSSLHPSISSRHHQKISVFSLVDPNIELPTISANEVEQIFSQLQSSNTSSQPTSRKTTGNWLSKDDSFTPPPIKRSFGGCITPAVSYSNNPVQTQQSSQMRTSSLVAALQLPPLGSVNANSNSSASPPLHVALRRQLLAPLNTLTNLSGAAKQRQENLTVRLANRAKLTAAARIPAVANGSLVDSESNNYVSSLYRISAYLTFSGFTSFPVTKSANVRPLKNCGGEFTVPTSFKLLTSSELNYNQLMYFHVIRGLYSSSLEEASYIVFFVLRHPAYAPFCCSSPLLPTLCFLPYLTDGVVFSSNPHKLNPTPPLFQSFVLPVMFLLELIRLFFRNYVKQFQNFVEDERTLEKSIIGQ